MTKSISPLHSILILLSLSLMVFLVNLDYTAVNLALVSIALDMEISMPTAQWILSANVLAWGSVVVLAGKMADVFGKRRILLCGSTLFVISSALVGLSPNIYVLIMGRILQGIGGALLILPIYNIAFISVQARNQGLAIGILGAAAGIGLAAGSSLSGFIIAHLGWQWIFLINVPFGLLTILIVLRVIDREPSRLSHQKIDHMGAFLLASGLIFMMIAFHQLENVGLHTTYFYSFLLLSCFSFFVFLKHQVGRNDQLIPFTLFQNKRFLTCVGANFLFEFIFSCFIVLIAVYLQNILDYDTELSGYLLLSMGLMLALLSPISGKLLDLYGGLTPILCGLMLLFAGFCLTLFLGGENSHLSSPPYIIMTFIIIGTGFGLCFSPINTLVMQSVSTKNISTAFGIFTMIDLLGCSSGVIIGSDISSYLSKHYLEKKLSQTHLALSLDQTETIYKVAAFPRYSPDDLSSFSDHILDDVVHIIDSSYIEAMSSIFLFSLGLILIAALSSFRFLKNEHN